MKDDFKGAIKARQHEWISIHTYKIRLRFRMVLRNIRSLHTTEQYNLHAIQKTITAGFEPTRAEPSGFRVHRLNHSATLSLVMEDGQLEAFPGGNECINFEF